MTRKSPFRRMRKRLETLADSPALLDGVARFASSQIERRYAATTWERRGHEGLATRDRADVVLATWHGRLAMSPFLWDHAWGPVATLTSAARPGRIVGRVHRHFGIESLPMRDRKRNRGESMRAARLFRDGYAVGFACDGPSGPARHMQPAALYWARLSGAPIWLWAYSVERFARLPTWDHMMLPRGRGRGIMLYRAWDKTVPRRATQEEFEQLRQELEADLNALTREADLEMGHPDIVV